MPRKFLQRISPHPDKVRNNRWLRGLSHVLHQPSLWHLNRHSASRGVAVGMFWGFIPIPGQTLLAVLTAVKARGNVALAVLMPWVVTPILLPVWYLAYRLGLLILRQEPIDNFFDNIRALKGFSASVRWFWHHRDAVWPLVIGSLPVAIAVSAASYFTILWLWRRHLLKRLRRRATRLDAESRLQTPVTAA